MIRFDHVSVHYDSADTPVLRDVDLHIDAGEFVLVTGRTGAGKSTLLRACNGLVPHFTGGTLTGRVLIDGRSTAEHPPRELAHLVGMVGQDPLAGFVTDTVEEELAYGMEQLGVAPDAMRRRIEETLDLLGIVDLRHRALHTLSGGQQQRVAIGAVITMHPPVLVLDEPTSALDPTAAEDVLATLARLVHDLGTTVIVAEHRIERVIPFVDRMLHVTDAHTVLDGDPRELLATLDRVPPIVELGRHAGWSPLPLTVRDARAALRATPLTLPAPARGTRAAHARSDDADAAPVLDARGMRVQHGRVDALRGVDVAVAGGEVLAIMGRNGAGKSSLLWALCDERSRSAGELRTTGSVALVPQTASDLLVASTVDRELRDADARAGRDAGDSRTLLDSLAPGIAGDMHPRDLSVGSQLALVLAMQLVSQPDVVLLDEPTRGLDYHAKAALATIIARLAADGAGVVVATHDVEFVATVADQVLVLADGSVLTHGPAAEVLAASPSFAPQVTKVLGTGWLTVQDVIDAGTSA